MKQRMIRSGEEKTDMRKKSTGVLLSIYIIYTVSILINDYISYCFGIKTYLSGCIIFMLSLAVCWFAGKRTRDGKLSPEPFMKGSWIDTVMILCILAVSAVKIVFPDVSYDVSNYHIYYQEAIDRDIFHYDFFPIRAFNAHYFILGDRMFYPFRALLGYRLGTILNTIVMVIVYLQVSDLVSCVFENSGKQYGKAIVPVAAIAVLFTENVLWNNDMYLVDFLPVPFLMEMVRVVFFQPGDRKKYEAVYLCLLAGLCIAIKISNAYFIIPMAIYYLIKNRKNIRARQYIASLGVLLFSISIYMIISVRLTGNPVFPYMNGLFHSDWFSYTESPQVLSALVSRYGPNGILETIFWPVVMVLNPSQTGDIHFCSGRVLLTWICLGFLWLMGNAKENKPLRIITILWLYQYVLSIFAFEGYNRYVPLLDLFGGIVILYALVLFLSDPKFFKRVIATGISCFLYYQVYLVGIQYFGHNVEWAWRPNAVNNLSSYLDNARYLLNDKGGLANNNPAADSFDEWVVLDCDGAYAYLMNPDIPIIGLKYTATNEFTREKLDERIEQTKGKKIGAYMTIYSDERCLGQLSEHNFLIESMQSFQADFFDSSQPITLMQLSYTDQDLEYSGHASLFDGDYLKEIKDHTVYYIGYWPRSTNWGSDGFIAEIYATNGTEEKLIQRYEIEPYAAFHQFQVPEEYNGWNLSVRVSNKEGHHAADDNYYLIACHACD